MPGRIVAQLTSRPPQTSPSQRRSGRDPPQPAHHFGYPASVPGRSAINQIMTGSPALPGQCFAAVLGFFPLCFTLPAPFLVLPFIDLAPCLAFLAAPMADSSFLANDRANATNGW